MDMGQLVDKYFKEIKIEDTFYDPYTDETRCDPAVITLNIPTAMLKEYLALTGQNGELPDAAEFWKETGLGNRLRARTSEILGHEPLADILDLLEGDVDGGYQQLNSSERIRLYITEVLEIQEE